MQVSVEAFDCNVVAICWMSSELNEGGNCKSDVRSCRDESIDKFTKALHIVKTELLLQSNGHRRFHKRSNDQLQILDSLRMDWFNGGGCIAIWNAPTMDGQDLVDV